MTNLDNIQVVLDDPRFLEGRMVIISQEDGLKRGYISLDGQKFIEYISDDIYEVINKLESYCKAWLE